MKTQIMPLNEAEGIFFPAFDQYLCHDEEITVDYGEKKRLWDSLSFRGGKRFCIHWKGQVELGAYDHFLCFLSIPPGMCIRGFAVVDQRRQQLFSDVAGGEAPIEAGGPLQKGEAGLLTDIFLEVEGEMKENVVILSWLGAFAREKLELAEQRVPRWQPSWEGNLVPGVAGGLMKNLILSEDEGNRLKDLVRQDKRLKEYFADNARQAMNIDAEKIIREYVPVAPHMYRFVRERDRGRPVLEGPVLNLAIAGWVLDEARYSFQAAKLIMALTAMKWFEGPVCELEGSEFHHVCFTEEHLLTEVTLATGFLGGVLKPEAQKRILDKVKEVWAFVRDKSMEPGYRNYMNQGIVGNRGVMLGAAFLQLWTGGYEACLEDCYNRHGAIVRNYLTESGHCAEGANYFEYSFSASILLWHVYARQKGLDIQEVVPERFRRAGRYMEALMSSTDRSGARIPLNCTNSASCSTLLLVFMTMVCQFPEGNQYLAARFYGETVEGTEKSFDYLFYLCYKEQVGISPYTRPMEEEISFHEDGLLSYRRGHTKLLVMAERNPLTGHFHEDRGGIVLESGGETLLPELGTTSYANPMCLMMDKKEYHNLACPARLEMAVESGRGRRAAAQAGHPLKEELTLEMLKLPEARVLYGEKRKEGYAFAVETGMLYGDGIRGVRSGILGEHTLSLKDAWSFPAKEPLLVTFLSYEPWVVDRERNQAKSGRLTLTADVLGDWDFEAEEEMADFEHKPVYVMRICVKESETQEVNSYLSWKEQKPSPDGSGRENTLALQGLLNRGGVIRLEEPGIYEIEDTLVIGSHTHLIFGAGVFLKRSKTSVGSFAIANRGAFTGEADTDIIIEGLHLITGGVEARTNAAVYGLTGQLSFFHINHLRITDFVCLDLPRLSFGIHVCTFEDLVIERVRIEGRKDAVHLGKGKRFVIRHGLFRTFDDPIALNAHDYAVANPQMGWIEDGLIEDCYDLADEDTTGYFCRILAGAWCDWRKGMEIQNSDTVVHNGRVYRAFQEPDGTRYRSETPPEHVAGMETLDGIHWVMVQDDATYQCGCRNIHFKDIHLQKERDMALSIHFDHDAYSRSVYPGAVMPVQENLVFEHIIMNHKIGCLVRSITPVNTVKILNSVISSKLIQLETLEGAGDYQKTKVLAMGNTYSGHEPMELVSCEKGRSCGLSVVGSLVEHDGFRAVISGDAVVEQTDIFISTGEETGHE